MALFQPYGWTPDDRISGVQGKLGKMRNGMREMNSRMPFFARLFS